MKNLVPTLFATALAVLPLSSTRAALDPKIVSADARWLVHVDFNLLRQSAIGRDLLETAAKNHPMENDSPVQIDFQKVLAAVGRATAYGANFAQERELVDGTLVVEGTADLRKIAEGYVAQTMLSQPDQLTELKDLPFEAYSLKGDVFIGFPKEPIILVSKVKAQLVRAYELYRGNGASMAKAPKSPLRDLLPPSRDAFLVAASVIPGDTLPAADGPHARLMKMAQAASVSLGEKDLQTFANVKLLANSADTADKLLKIVQGLTAMASLAQSENNELETFMKSVTVERQDLAVLLRLSYPSDRLSGMIKTMQQEHSSGPHEFHAGDAGRIVAEWKADQALGGDEPSEANRAVRAIEKVHLSSGAVIRIIGKPDGNEHARIDYVEIEAPGAAALKFEAEYLKLSRYRVEKSAAASGGKLIAAHGGPAVAELQFPGAPGDYTLKVHYFDEADGASAFTVRVEEPAADAKD